MKGEGRSSPSENRGATEDVPGGWDRERVVRFRRQRTELASGPFVFESLSRADAVRLVRLGLEDHDARPATAEMTPAPEPVGMTSAPDPAPSIPSELPADHDELRTLTLGCTRCGLARNRTQVVFHDGTPKARLMVVGEAPGANEDKTGIPFVGRAGKFLDLLMASVGLSRRDSVYICNVIKCRPPGNRNPKADEIAACSPYLKRQIQIVQPQAILAVGTFSAQLLTGKDIALGRIRGEVYSYEGAPVVVTYHPAALLRNARWIRPTWEDFQLLRRVMDPSPS